MIARFPRSPMIPRGGLDGKSGVGQHGWRSSTLSLMGGARDKKVEVMLLVGR